MISRIRGKLSEKRSHGVILDVEGLSYEVWIPQAILRSLDRHLQPDGTLSLVTYHYHQVDPSRSIPILVGFLNEIEKEFFERFITVSGVGPKAAVRALALPIPTIAQAIDQGNASLLKSLPGIGDQRAREIIAKLQGKVGKFGLIQETQASTPAAPGAGNVQEEAMSVLLQLQYSRAEARQMIQKVLEKNSKIASAEELLNEVYRQRSHGAVPA